MTIVDIRERYRRPTEITPAEIHASPEPSELMVWEVCPYLRNLEGCQQCPSSKVEEGFGEVRRGCYGLAVEVCRIVMAVQRREDGRTPPKP